MEPFWGSGRVLAPKCHLGPSWWPTWPQLGSQNGAKIDKKSIQKMIKILMPPETRFLRYFDGFWVDFGGMLASKMESRWMLSSRGHFLKKLRFPTGKSMILKDPGVEVGSPNRSKIDQKRNSSWEGILASIFLWILVDFGGQVGTKLGSKIDKKSIQNGIQKIDAKKKAF